MNLLVHSDLFYTSIILSEAYLVPIRKVIVSSQGIDFKNKSIGVIVAGEFRLNDPVYYQEEK
jgi:hypothetical protein